MADPQSPKQGSDESGEAKAQATTSASAVGAGVADAARATAGRAAEAMRDGAARAGNAFNDTVMDPARRAGEALKESGQKIAAGGSAVGLKMIEQAEANSREAFAAMRAAAGARDLSEVMKIQGDFLREQGTRSISQAREMGEMIAQFGRDAVAPLKGSNDR